MPEGAELRFLPASTLDAGAELDVTGCRTAGTDASAAWRAAGFHYKSVERSREDLLSAWIDPTLLHVLGHFGVPSLPLFIVCSL